MLHPCLSAPVRIPKLTGVKTWEARQENEQQKLTGSRQYFTGVTPTGVIFTGLAFSGLIFHQVFHRGGFHRGTKAGVLCFQVLIIWFEITF